MVHVQYLFFRRVSDEEIDNLGIKVIEGYADPYHGRY